MRRLLLSFFVLRGGNLCVYIYIYIIYKCTSITDTLVRDTHSLSNSIRCPPTQIKNVYRLLFLFVSSLSANSSLPPADTQFLPPLLPQRELLSACDAAAAAAAAADAGVGTVAGAVADGPGAGTSAAADQPP